MEIGYVTSKGQIVIPARLRRRYGIKTGTKVCFVEKDEAIVLQPVTKEYIRGIYGMLKGKGVSTDDLLEDRAKDLKREETRLEKRRSR